MFDDFRLKVFEAVAEERSFTRAARALGVSQSAVSQSVAELERQLGVQLFHRDRTSVRLTAEGQAFSRYARNILHWYGAAREAFAPGIHSPERGIRVLASPDLVSSVVPEIFAPAFSGDRPYPVVNITSGRLASEGSSDRNTEYDICISSGLADGSIRWGKGECAGVSPLCVIARPSDRNAYSGVFSLSGVKDRGLALWTGWQNDEGTDEASVVGLDNIHKVVFRSDSPESVIGAVLSSDGLLGAVPLYCVYKKLADRTLSRLPVMFPSGNIAVYVQASDSFSTTRIYKATVERLSSLLAVTE